MIVHNVTESGQVCNSTEVPGGPRGRRQHKSFGGAANPCEGLGMHCIILFLVLSMSVADADAAAGVRCAIVCSVYLCVVIEHGPAPCQLLLREVGLSLDMRGNLSRGVFP